MAESRFAWLQRGCRSAAALVRPSQRSLPAVPPARGYAKDGIVRVDTGNESGVAAIEAALTFLLFFVTLFSLIFFMLAAYRSVALQLISAQLAEQLAIGAVCSGALSTTATELGNKFMVPITTASINGQIVGSGRTQPFFLVTLQAQSGIDILNLTLNLQGVAMGVAEEEAC